MTDESFDPTASASSICRGSDTRRPKPEFQSAANTTRGRRWLHLTNLLLAIFGVTLFHGAWIEMRRVETMPR
jgi:hypothetical protein